MNFKTSLAARMAAALLLCAAGAAGAADVVGPPAGTWLMPPGPQRLGFEFRADGTVRMLAQMDARMRQALPTLPADKQAAIAKMRVTVQGTDWLAAPGKWTASSPEHAHLHVDMAGKPQPLDLDIVYHLENDHVMTVRSSQDAPNAPVQRFQRVGP